MPRFKPPEEEFLRKDLFEAKYEALQEAIDDIKNNHLEHINTRIDRLCGKVDKLMWLMLTLLGSVIATGIILVVK